MKITRRLIWRAGGLLAVLVVSAAFLSWLVWLPPNGENINRVETSEKIIALTFDDGPNPPHTEAILELLERHGARATFFMTGERLDEFPGSAAEVMSAGHQIGNHGVDGTILAFRNREFIGSQIAEVDAAIRGIGYAGEIPFRAPRGMQFLNVAKVLREQGRPHIGAGVIGRDWRDGENAESIAARVIDGAKPGAIVSLHDGDDATSNADRSATVEALSRVLVALGDEYRFVTVEELVALAH